MTAEPRLGRVDPAVAEEFPKLGLWELRERLRLMSNRFHGARAIAMRREPVPHAYRVFFRHIGLDPDEHRVPAEAAAVERLRAGGFKSRNLLDDALTIAVVETGVPVWALDADRVSGELEIRTASAYEPFAPTVWLPEGRFVVADDEGPVAELFGDISPGRGVTPETRRTLLFSVQVDGVPAIHVDEALSIVEEILTERYG